MRTIGPDKKSGRTIYPYDRKVDSSKHLLQRKTAWLIKRETLPLALGVRTNSARSKREDRCLLHFRTAQTAEEASYPGLPMPGCEG